MTALYDVAAIGNAIVDVIAPVDEAFLAAEGVAKGAMTLIDEARAQHLYAAMPSERMETSGGSAGNTVAGVASFGGRAAYLAKVADDALGETFAGQTRAIGVHFDTAPLVGGPRTARSMIVVTPDGERSMNTFLGASTEFSPDDVDARVIEASRIVYLEGYLFDAELARHAFAKAAGLARASDRLIALTLSDIFVADRHREALLGFIESQVDVLFANEAELTSLFQTTDFDAALGAVRTKARIAAVTRSERGSVVAAGAETHLIPAFPVEKVVDTTGAGDQYAAGFMFGLATDRSYEACARLGHLAAAEVISHYGPRPQVSLKDLAAQQGL